MASEKIILRGHSRRALDRINLFGPTKIRLDASVDETTRKIARAYGRAWQVVRGEAAAMSEYAAERRHEGLAPRDIARLDRVDRAMHALERQVRSLSKHTGVTVIGAANRQVEHDVDTVLNSLSELTGLDRRFTKPSGAAMEHMILRSTGRIEAASRRLNATQGIALKDGLFRGLVLGQNPRETARAIYHETEGAFFGGLNRATTIAATELSDAHRYANRLTYSGNELVVGWKWLAQLSPRTCPACWALHNQRFESSEMQYGHQRCRCTMVPILADDEEADHDLGDPEEIFWNLSRDEQLQIMGPGRLKALEAGVRFADLTHLRHNAEWRPSYAVTRVSDLEGLAELNVATTPGDLITIPGQTNASVMSLAYKQGGMTIHALTGEQPTRGYVVARKGTSLVIDAREFFGPKGPAELATWMKRHGDRLDEPGAHVGMWYDTANGKVVLDVVEILDDRDAAIRLGQAEDQIAIFDLNTFSEIQTGGTGGYADNSVSTALSGSAIGRTAEVFRDGKRHEGKVIASGDWGVMILTADGERVSAGPDQYHFTSGVSEAVVEKHRQIDEIETNASHGIPVDYDRGTVQTAQGIDDSLEDVAGDWSGVKPEHVSIGKPDSMSGAFAVTDTSFTPSYDGRASHSNITVNSDYAQNFSKWRSDMLNAEDRGHFHRGTSDDPIDYTVDHEYGHVLAMRLLGDPRLRPGVQARAEIVGSLFNRYFADEIKKDPSLAMRWGTNEEMLKVVETWNSDRRFRERLINDLSGYGATNPDEFIAEGFAVFRDHGPGESVAADTIMRGLVNAYLKHVGSLPNEDEILELLEGAL